MKKQSIAVYGSTWIPKHKYEAHVKAAKAVGKVLGERKIDVVYGGGQTGLMGTCAQAAHENSGKITGIVPKNVFPEFLDSKVGEMVYVEDFYERMKEYNKRSEGFIALPGAYGTLHEIMEAISMSRCGIQKKPTLFINTVNFWNKLRSMFNLMQAEDLLNDEVDESKVEFIDVHYNTHIFERDLNNWLDVNNFVNQSDIVHAIYNEKLHKRTQTNET